MNVTKEQVLEMLNKGVQRHGSLRAYAREIGISAAYLSDTLRGNRNPAPAILSHLGLTKAPPSPAPPQEYRKTEA